MITHNSQVAIITLQLKLYWVKVIPYHPMRYNIHPLKQPTPRTSLNENSTVQLMVVKKGRTPLPPQTQYSLSQFKNQQMPQLSITHDHDYAWPGLGQIYHLWFLCLQCTCTCTNIDLSTFWLLEPVQEAISISSLFDMKILTSS